MQFKSGPPPSTQFPPTKFLGHRPRLSRRLDPALPRTRRRPSPAPRHPKRASNATVTSIDRISGSTRVPSRDSSLRGNTTLTLTFGLVAPLGMAHRLDVLSRFNGNDSRRL